jgi:peptide/nickel transport system substrate-binding protein
MKRFREQLIAAIAFVLLGNVAATAETKPLTVVLGSEARSLDPSIDSNGLTLPVTNTVMETLARTGPDLTLIPLLAESWQSLGGNKWRVKLRSGVKFHDGSPLNADALIFSIDVFRNTKGAARGYFSFISGAEKVDDLTVDVATDGPTSIFPSTLPYLYVFPPAYYKSVGPDGFGKKPVGTGPWTFESWAQGVEIVVTPNTNYWGKKPEIGTIRFRAAPDASTRVAQLLTGESQLATDIPPAMIERVQSSGVARIEETKTIRAMYLQINMKEGPTADVRVRRGLAHAIDVGAIVKGLYRGHASYGEMGFVLDGMEGYEPGTAKLPAYDPELAKKLFAEAGYANGFTLPLWYTIGRYLLDKEAAEAIGGQLKHAGVEVQLNGMEPAAYFTKTAHERVPGVNLFSCSPLFVNAVFCPIVHYKIGANWDYGANERTDQYIKSIVAELDDKKRAQLIREFSNYTLNELVPMVWLWRQEAIYGVSNSLNWKPQVDEKIWFSDMSWKQ